MRGYDGLSVFRFGNVERADAVETICELRRKARRHVLDDDDRQRKSHVDIFKNIAERVRAARGNSDRNDFDAASFAERHNDGGLFVFFGSLVPQRRCDCGIFCGSDTLFFGDKALGFAHLYLM